MLRLEDHCVSCGLPCLGNYCPNKNVPVRYCDECGAEGAKYTVEKVDICEDCLGEYLQSQFDELALFEKLELFCKQYEVNEI